MRVAIPWLILAACGSQSAGPRGGAVVIAADQALGWIGIAPRPARSGDWLPVGAQSLVVPTPATGITAGAALSAIGVSGDVSLVIAGGSAKVAYGCERNQLDAIVFSGARLAPGPVWVLPPHPPESWHPSPLAIELASSPSEASRSDRVGPLTLELKRTDPSHGTLSITRDGRPLHTMPIAREAMDGADPGPIDLRGPGVAIPEPVGAWSFAAGGPILLVLLVPSYEGQQLRAFLIEDARTRELTEMEHYLYQCAL